MTADDLQVACNDVYGPSGWRHAPAQVFLDTFAGEPPTTFLRVSFPHKFTNAACMKLEVLRKVLLNRHGECRNIVLCVYLSRMDADDMARHSLAMADR